MTPSRNPPLPICSGWPSSSETFSSSSTPVARMRTRSGSSSKRRATSAAGRRRGRECRAPASRTRAPRRPGCAARWRCRRPRRPGRDGRSRPPRRCRRCGRGPCGSRPPRAGRRRAARRRARRADPPGAHLLDPAVTVPRITSVEPPPTSTTPTLPATGWPSVLVAPMKESRPSSSSLRTSTGTPAASPIAAAASSPLAASRTQRWRRRGSSSAPSSRASRTWVETTSQTSSIFSAADRAVAVDRLVDPRVGPLLHHLLSWPSPGSATSTRVVLEPISMAAQSIRASSRMFPDGAGSHTSRHEPDRRRPEALRPDARRPRTRGRAR